MSSEEVSVRNRGKVLSAGKLELREAKVKTATWFRANSHLLSTDGMPLCPSFGSTASLGHWGGTGGGMECGGLRDIFLIVIVCLSTRHRPSFGCGWGLCGQGRPGCGGRKSA